MSDASYGMRQRGCCLVLFGYYILRPVREQISATYGFLRETVGMAMTTLSWCMVPIALCRAGLGSFIGRENARVHLRESEQSG